MCKAVKKVFLSECLLVLTLMLLTGCQNINSTEASVNTESDGGFVSMQEDSVIDYDVPRSTPHILVDQHGYLTDSTKYIFFFGEEIPKTFSVIDEETGEEVLIGIPIDRGFSEEYGTQVAMGDISKLSEEGTYYVRAELLGESFRFKITDDLYGELFKEAQKTYYYNRCGITLTENYANTMAHNACHVGESILREDMTVSIDVTGGWHQDSSGSKDVVQAAETMASMLMSYEIFPEVFSDDVGIPESGNGIPDILDECRYETEWLLKMQNLNTGAVYSAVTVAEGQEATVSYVEPSSNNASLAFAYILAKFSFLYQSYDLEFATNCLKASDRAWRYSVLNEQTGEEVSNWKVAAASEIYRASGVEDCRDFVNDYWQNTGIVNPEDRIILLAGVTYINTKQPVETQYCEQITKAIMKRAEAISEISRSCPFLVPSNVEQSNNSELLNNMVVMTVVDYIISNHEYDTIIQNYLHYFLGRNALSITYLDNVGSFSYKEIHESLGLMKQFDQDSKLIFMLSKVLGDGYAY